MSRFIPLSGAAFVLLLAAWPSALAAQGREGFARVSPEASLSEAQALLDAGRPLDAERVLEKAVARRPLAVPDMEGRLSAVTVLYLRVRARVLPVMAEAMYGSAKAAYDDGRLELASAQFDDLRRLVDSAGMRIEGLTDLGMLADGFTRLIRRRLEPPVASIPVEHVTVTAEENSAPVAILQPEPVAPVPMAAATRAPEPKPFASWRPQIYGPDDSQVTPPAVIDQTLPPWVAPAGFARRTFQGLLAVVVGEDGLVASAEMVAPTFPAYDALLLSTAKRWRYEPAGRDGRAVRFRKVIAINLLGRSDP
jgi:hypothetical protein